MEKVTDDLQACGVPAALEAMGDRWSFMILRAAFNGICHFEDFIEPLGIARNILSNRLGRLVDTGIMERVICAHDRRKAEYRLTPKGVDLLPALLALRNWGEKYGLGVASNPVLVDRQDRQPVRPITVQGHDGRPLGWSDLMWLDKAEVGQPAALAADCCD
jgi:DNA-binding HxlR family transcriptional regulator